MARVSKKWWGFYLDLNHAEACAWTKVVSGGGSAADIAGDLVKAVGVGWFTGPIGLAVAVTVLSASTYIRSMNQQSGGEGVRLKFTWPATYIGCSRRGSGSAPCPN